MVSRGWNRSTAAVVNVCFWLIRRAEARPCDELWRLESACDFDAGENGQMPPGGRMFHL